MGITAASTEPRSTRSNTSAERAQGTMVQPGTMRPAASWLKEPDSPWMATFMQESYLSEGEESKFFCSTKASRPPG